jgi:hypothetical protein
VEIPGLPTSSHFHHFLCPGGTQKRRDNTRRKGTVWGLPPFPFRTVPMSTSRLHTVATYLASRAPPRREITNDEQLSAPRGTFTLCLAIKLFPVDIRPANDAQTIPTHKMLAVYKRAPLFKAVVCTCRFAVSANSVPRSGIAPTWNVAWDFWRRAN